jgi:hypothetical protein
MMVSNHRHEGVTGFPPNLPPQTRLIVPVIVTHH